MLNLAFGAASVVAIAIVFRAAPRSAMIVWAATLFVIPIWVGFSAGIFFSAITAVTLLAVAGASLRGLTWSPVDSILLTFGAVVIIAATLGAITTGHTLIVMLDWLLPYLWGRIVLSRVGMPTITSAIATMTVVASCLAIIEFVSGTNPFVLIPWNNSGYALWSNLQPRGGFLRAEGALGHSISLGACLSMGSVYLLAASWSIVARIIALCVVGTAIVLTFSRIGLIGFALGLLLALFFLGRILARRIRVLVTVVLIAGTGIATPFLSDAFDTAGTEATGSALYRLDLLELVPRMSLIGLSDDYRVLPDGSVFVDDFESIDSTLILTGLRLGVVPLLLLGGLLIAAVVAVLRRRSNPALVALVAQIPTLATVALITEIPYLLWFSAGLGVTLYILERSRNGPPDSIGAVDILPEREGRVHG